MKDIISDFFKILTDKTISLSRRTTGVIFIIALILLANDTFNFSFNYRINNKIEQFKSIYSLYPKTAIDTSNVKQTLLSLENEIKYRTPFITKFKEFWSEVASDELSEKQKNFIYKLISANIIFFILFIYFLFSQKDKKARNNTLLGLLFTTLFFNLIFFFLPNFSNIMITHSIHIISVIILIILMGWYGRKK